MPENEIPPVIRGDIYYCIFYYKKVYPLLLLSKLDTVSILHISEDDSMKTNKLSISILLALVLTFAITLVNDACFSAPGTIIRLHILANSDTAEDQALKLQVRDRILAEVTRLCGSTTAPDQFIIGHQDLIRTIAEDEVQKRGYQYPVTVEYGNFAFPVKEYGGYVFPAGMYDGVRIRIGAGAGQNWWCVMYPPLCFTGETTGEVSPDAQARLQESATLVEDGDKVVVRPKLKIAEWWDRMAG